MKKDVRQYEDDVIGLIVPDYYSEMPLIVRRFIEGSSFTCNYFYLLVTYGCHDRIAVEWGKYYLESLGIRVHYANSILMVDNYVPGFDMSKEIAIDKKIGDQLTVLKQDLEDRRVWYKVPDAQAHASYDRSLNGGYQTKVRDDSRSFALNADVCIGCGICTKVCPIGNMKLEEKKAVRVQEICEVCLACLHHCPKKAITMIGRDVNPSARYRHPEITLKDIIDANHV